MVTLHTPCNKFLEVRAAWPQQEPVFYVDDRMRETCPVCDAPLTFETLYKPRSLNDLTPEEQKIWFENVDPIPF